MPELIEVDAYRRAASGVTGLRISRVDTPDHWYLKGGIGPGSVRDALGGATVTAVRRRGKLLLVDTDRRVVLGLRFGMTGRLLTAGPAAEALVDGDAARGAAGGDPVGRLLYGPTVDRQRYVRFALGFTDQSALWITDPRRLGGVELDPDESRLGPEATDLDATTLAHALLGSSAPLKAALMDQRRVAGLGNLLCDEILWRAGLAPTQPAGELGSESLSRLAEAITGTVAELTERGGSHTGDLQPSRGRGGLCPRCAAPLRRDEVGGRTTYWCPREQA